MNLHYKTEVERSLHDRDKKEEVEERKNHKKIHFLSSFPPPPKFNATHPNITFHDLPLRKKYEVLKKEYDKEKQSLTNNETRKDKSKEKLTIYDIELFTTPAPEGIAGGVKRDITPNELDLALYESRGILETTNLGKKIHDSKVLQNMDSETLNMFGKGVSLAGGALSQVIGGNGGNIVGNAINAVGKNLSKHAVVGAQGSNERYINYLTGFPCQPSPSKSWCLPEPKPSTSTYPPSVFELKRFAARQHNVEEGKKRNEKLLEELKKNPFKDPVNEEELVDFVRSDNEIIEKAINDSGNEKKNQNVQKEEKKDEIFYSAEDEKDFNEVLQGSFEKRENSRRKSSKEAIRDRIERRNASEKDTTKNLEENYLRYKRRPYTNEYDMKVEFSPEMQDEASVDTQAEDNFLSSKIKLEFDQKEKQAKENEAEKKKLEFDGILQNTFLMIDDDVENTLLKKEKNFYLNNKKNKKNLIETSLAQENAQLENFKGEEEKEKIQMQNIYSEDKLFPYSKGDSNTDKTEKYEENKNVSIISSVIFDAFSDFDLHGNLTSNSSVFLTETRKGLGGKHRKSRTSKLQTNSIVEISEEAKENCTNNSFYDNCTDNDNVYTDNSIHSNRIMNSNKNNIRSKNNNSSYSNEFLAGSEARREISVFTPEELALTASPPPPLTAEEIDRLEKEKRKQQRKEIRIERAINQYTHTYADELRMAYTYPDYEMKNNVYANTAGTWENEVKMRIKEEKRKEKEMKKDMQEKEIQRRKTEEEAEKHRFSLSMIPDFKVDNRKDSETIEVNNLINVDDVKTRKRHVLADKKKDELSKNYKTEQEIGGDKKLRKASIANLLLLNGSAKKNEKCDDNVGLRKNSYIQVDGKFKEEKDMKEFSGVHSEKNELNRLKNNFELSSSHSNSFPIINSILPSVSVSFSTKLLSSLIDNTKTHSRKAFHASNCTISNDSISNEISSISTLPQSLDKKSTKNQKSSLSEKFSYLRDTPIELLLDESINSISSSFPSLTIP